MQCPEVYQGTDPLIPAGRATAYQKFVQDKLKDKHLWVGVRVGSSFTHSLRLQGARHWEYCRGQGAWHLHYSEKMNYKQGND